MKKQYSPIPEYDGFEPKKPSTPQNTDQSALSKNISKSTEVRTDVQAIKHASKQTSNTAVLQAINITILQNDVTDLEEPAIQAQTFRLTPKEVKQLKKLAYTYSDDLGRKVGQGDIVRLGLLFINKLEKGVLQDLLQKIM